MKSNLSVEVITSTYKLNSKLQKEISSILNKNNLTFIQFICLRYIILEKKATMSKIADYLEITLSSCSQLIDRMITEKFVQRRFDQKDRRIVLITVTQQGKKAAAKVNYATLKSKDKIYLNITKTKLNNLLELENNILQIME